MLRLDSREKVNTLGRYADLEMSKIDQPVEKVRIRWGSVLEHVNLRKEKSMQGLCLINLFRFCPAATITPSLFILSKRRKRNHLKR
jgi:hypothetical protein